MNGKIQSSLMFCLVVAVLLFFLMDRGGLEKYETKAIVNSRESYLSAVDGWIFMRRYAIQFEMSGKKYVALISPECYEKTEIGKEIRLEYAKSRILRHMEFQCAN